MANCLGVEADQMKHSINSLVPNRDAQLVLLWELYKCGGEGDTGYTVDRAMAHFPALQAPTELNRETPSSRPWWPGNANIFSKEI